VATDLGRDGTLDDALADAYLEKLGVEARPGEVDTVKLAELQRAHVSAVPYENIDIVRGDPPGIDPLDCARRIVGGRGGYCFHLNGGFSALLRWLRVDLTKHVSGVQGGGAPEPPGPNGNHLGLTVRFPGDGQVWLVDAGLGDGPAASLPLTYGRHEQDGCVYGLAPSPLAPGGWRFEHDPRGAFVLVDFAPAPATTSDFEAMHVMLSTSPDSGFVRVATAQRRTAAGLELLRGCVFTEPNGAGVRTRELGSADEWWGVVVDGFGLAYDDLPRSERERMWSKVKATHDAWDAAGRP
jgi:N-hydroxyarylamine O-acetyltransferase